MVVAGARGVTGEVGGAEVVTVTVEVGGQRVEVPARAKTGLAMPGLTWRLFRY